MISGFLVHHGHLPETGKCPFEIIFYHSVLRLFTGLVTAARSAWTLMVISAIKSAAMVVITKTVQLMFFRYAKSSNHLFITHHATGEAMSTEITTSFRNSFESSATMPPTLAPRTLRTPISLVRCSALNVARPNKPRHDMRMAITVK